MKGNLVFKIFFSILFLGVFFAYSYMHFSSGWFTSGFSEAVESLSETGEADSRRCPGFPVSHRGAYRGSY